MNLSYDNYQHGTLIINDAYFSPLYHLKSMTFLNQHPNPQTVVFFGSGLNILNELFTIKHLTQKNKIQHIFFFDPIYSFLFKYIRDNVDLFNLFNFRSNSIKEVRSIEYFNSIFSHEYVGINFFSFVEYCNDVEPQNIDTFIDVLKNVSSIFNDISCNVAFISNYYTLDILLDRIDGNSAAAYGFNVDYKFFDYKLNDSRMIKILNNVTFFQHFCVNICELNIIEYSIKYDKLCITDIYKERNNIT